ncbi:MAG: putative toxin-antitoxin system toxin component, PIN family [Janthinobacterium lividum]
MSVFVVDANVVVSAALSPSSISRQAIATARRHGTIALSEAVFGEVNEVLSRPKFRRAISDDRRREVLELLSAAAAWFEPAQTIAECRDAKDNRYLELALVAGAKVIVSGDDDLLVLDQWRGTRIMKPAAFLAWVPHIS